MPDFITRWAIAVCIFAVGVGCGAVLGLRYEQAQRDLDQANEGIAVQKQATRVAVIQGKQALTNKETSHALNSDLAASDAYWRVRVPTDRAGSVPILSGHPEGTSNDAPQLAPGSAGDSGANGAGTGCSPADGSADAILAVRWWIWAMEQGRAINSTE